MEATEKELEECKIQNKNKENKISLLEEVIRQADVK